MFHRIIENSKYQSIKDAFNSWIRYNSLIKHAKTTVEYQKDKLNSMQRVDELKQTVTYKDSIMKIAHK